MKRIAIALLLVAGLAGPVAAGPITNGGFELGNLSGWTTSGQTSVVTAGLDPRTSNALNMIGVAGSTYAAKIGDQVAYGYTGASASSISQTFNADATDLYFAWAAVAIVPTNGGHDFDDTPWFRVTIWDNTTSTSLVDQAFFTGNPGSITAGWLAGVNDPSSTYGQNSPGIWYYRPWEQFHLQGVTIGDSLTVTLLTRDCTLTGHASYAYLDGFGTAPPPITAPDAGSTLMLLGMGLAGLAAWKRR